MCGAACAGVVSGCSSSRPAAGWMTFLGGRLLGYAATGAIAASAVSMLGTLGESATALRALWTMLHAAALALGIWLLLTARQPAWMKRVGRPAIVRHARDAGWQRMSGPLRTGMTGAAWVALPCGLLQSALVVAALANDAAAGAATMSAFALTSSTGLAIVPAFALRWAGPRAAAATARPWVVRLAGAALAAASAWALGHGLWQRLVVICTT
jgi:uncharacterized protein